MESLQQCEHDTYRVIALGQNRTELLLVPHEIGFQLPSVEIPRWQRVAENLTLAVKNKWGCEAVCLFTLQDALKDDLCDGFCYQVMECWGHTEACVSNAVWVPLSSLSRSLFQEAADFAALQEFLSERNCHDEDADSPFTRSTWFRELQSWIAEVIQPLGLGLTGPFRQFNASPSFSLIRFQTSGPAVWFKAVGEPNQHEFGITLKLAQLFPSFLPRVIAVRPDWNGWLSFEAEGMGLGETREVSLWAESAEILARLQIESIGKANEIAASGARDLRGAALSTFVHPFFEVMAQLMRQQSMMRPPILSVTELRSLQEVTQDCFAQLEGLAVPDALGHLDLNPGNIIASPQRCTFLDWAEAYVGNPVFTFQYLLEHFRRSMGGPSAAEGRLIATYVEKWESRISSVAMNEALHLSPLLAVFAYAAGNHAWRDQERLKDPTIAGYLRGLTRRMNREANQMRERRSPCLC